MLTFPDCDSCRAELDYTRHEGLKFDTEPTQDLNVPLLLQVLLAIHTQPQLWDQRDFFRDRDCGTTKCFAGWTLSLSGFDENFSGSYSEGAQGLLNLTDDEREHLFFHLQTDDLQELTNTVKELTDARTS